MSSSALAAVLGAPGTPQWTVLRAAVSHPSWHMQAEPDATGKLTARLVRGPDGIFLDAWLDAADCPTPQTLTLRGPALFDAVHAGFAGLRLEPGTPRERRFSRAQFGLLAEWAAAARVTELVRDPDAFGGALIALRRYTGWRILRRDGVSGPQLALAPDSQGRKLAAIFTAEDTLRAFLDRNGDTLKAHGFLPAQVDGEALFATLDRTAGLDGMVFDCAGPVAPKAVAMPYAQAVLNASGKSTLLAVEQARRLADQAATLLARFVDPAEDHAALLAALEPRDGDAQMAFRADVADAMADIYAGLEAAQISLAPDQTEVSVAACPAELFGRPAPVNDAFAQGYERVAPYLTPGRVWLTWQYTSLSTERRVAFNGLVWLDDHWAWFPKPYQALDAVRASKGLS